MSWEKVSSEPVLNHPRLKLAEDTVRLPDGTTTQYLVIEGYSDYSTIIPVREDGKILMIREYAYPISEILLQFPEGELEAGESVEVGAARELQEEVSLKADGFEQIGSNLHWHRRSTARSLVVVASGLTDAEELEGDPEEAGITSDWYSEDQIWGFISDGSIIQKNALAAWAQYQAYKRSKQA